MTAIDELRAMLKPYSIIPIQTVEATLERVYESPVSMYWDGDVLVLTTTHDPSSIHVQRGEGQPRKVYPSEVMLECGECKNVSDPSEGFLCSECGWGDFAEPSHLLTSAYYIGLEKGPRFCPNCGRRVVVS